MRKSFIVAFVLLGMGGFATVAISAEELAAAVKERRHLMKEVVAPAAKLGGQMVKGVKPFDAAAAATAMNEINSVPDKYVKLFAKGTAHGEIADSEAKAKIWEDFSDFEATALKLKDASAQAAAAAAQGEGAFTAAFKEADGIKHDFKKRGFTELGNYRDFLTRQIVVEGAEKIAEGKTGEKEKENAPGVVPGAPASDILSRTAIKLVVK